MVDSHLDIFVPFSCGLVSFIFMMFVFVGSGWRSLRLVVLVFERCPELMQGCVTLGVDCLLLCDRYEWSYWFSKNVSNLCRGVLLYGVGCWLLCDRYVWSDWFSKNVLNFPVVCYSLMWAAGYWTIITTGRTGLMAVDWAVGYTKENLSIFLLYGDLPFHVLNL